MKQLALLFVLVGTMACAPTQQAKFDQTHGVYNRLSSSGLDYAESVKKSRQATGPQLAAACNDDTDKELQAACLIAVSVKKSGPVIREASRTIESSTDGAGDTEWLKVANEIIRGHVDLLIKLLSGV